MERVQQQRARPSATRDEAVSEDMEQAPQGTDSDELVEELDRVLDEIDELLEENEIKERECEAEEGYRSWCTVHDSAFVFSCSGKEEFCYGAIEAQG